MAEVLTMTPEIWLALIGAVTAIITAFIGAAKWSANRMGKAIDESTIAIIKNSASDAVVTTKLDEVIRVNTQVVTALTRLGDLLAPLVQKSPVVVQDEPKKPRRATAPAGTPILHLRVPTQREDD
jgi:hypothetical protein